MQEERDFTTIDYDSLQAQPLTLGEPSSEPTRHVEGPADHYQGAHSRAQAALSTSITQSVGSTIDSSKKGGRPQALRGRIHANNDVLNGISGMEHLSNSLASKKLYGGANESPAILAQMRG